MPKQILFLTLICLAGYMLYLPIPFSSHIFVPPWSTTDQHFFVLGSDGFGRDLGALLTQGLFVSLSTGLIATLCAGCMGLLLGLLAAISERQGDHFILRLIELKLSVPTLLIALLAHITFGQSFLTLTIAMGLSGWASLALMVRTISKGEVQKNYYVAAKLLGIHPFRIIVTHLLPNCLPALLPFLTYRFAYFIMLESSLSFLGLGLPQSKPSLGLLMNQGIDDMLSGRYWVAFFPAVLLSIVIVCLHGTADRLMNDRK